MAETIYILFASSPFRGARKCDCSSRCFTMNEKQLDQRRILEKIIGRQRIQKHQSHQPKMSLEHAKGKDLNKQISHLLGILGRDGSTHQMSDSPQMVSEPILAQSFTPNYSDVSQNIDRESFGLESIQEYRKDAYSPLKTLTKNWYKETPRDISSTYSDDKTYDQCPRRIQKLTNTLEKFIKGSQKKSASQREDLQALLRQQILLIDCLETNNQRLLSSIKSNELLIEEAKSHFNRIIDKISYLVHSAEEEGEIR